jgi:hypothetical protein
VGLVVHGCGMTGSEDLGGENQDHYQTRDEEQKGRTPVDRLRRTRGLAQTTAAFRAIGRRETSLRRRAAANYYSEAPREGTPLQNQEVLRYHAWTQDAGYEPLRLDQRKNSHAPTHHHSAKSGEKRRVGWSNY